MGLEAVLGCWQHGSQNVNGRKNGDEVETADDKWYEYSTGMATQLDVDMKQQFFWSGAGVVQLGREPNAAWGDRGGVAWAPSVPSLRILAYPRLAPGAAPLAIGDPCKSFTRGSSSSPLLS